MALSLICNTLAHAQSPSADSATTSPQVRITPSAAAVGDAQVLNSIMFGRAEIEATGEFMLGRILGKVPLITIDRAGYPALRGLGDGRTQILLDGVPMSGAALQSALTTLPAGVINRIEVTLGGSSDTSAQAMAGSIRIVTRRPQAESAKSQVRALLAFKQGHAQPKLSFQGNGTAFEISYLVAGFVQIPVDMREVNWTESIDLAPARNYHFASSTRSRDLSLSGKTTYDLSPSFQLGTRHAFAFGRSRTAATSTGDEWQQALASKNAAREIFFENELRTTARRQDDSRLELYAIQRSTLLRNSRSVNVTDDTPETSIANPEVSAFTRSNTLVVGAKHISTLRESFQLSAGGELSGERRTGRQDAIGTPARLESSQYSRACSAFLKLAGDVDQRLSLDAGLRVETITRTIDAKRRQFEIMTPSGSMLLKLPESAVFFNRLRVSVSRTFRPPKPEELSPLVSYSDTNSLFTPDRVGTVGLRSEKSTGLDATLSRDFGKGSNASVGIFHRDVRDPIFTTYAMDAGRWRGSSSNLDHARITGLEARAKWVMRDLLPSAPGCSIYADYRGTSVSVDPIGNSLTDEPRRSATVGGSCALASVKAEVNASLRFTNAYLAALPGVTLASFSTTRTELGYVQDLTKDAKLRLNATGLGHYWERRRATATQAGVSGSYEARRFAVFTAAIDMRW